MAFNALILSLPTRNSTVRMRIWRALKESGCAVLRDGVYVLPPDAPGSAVLSEMAAQVRAAGGSAMIAELRPGAAEAPKGLERLFDRTAEYGQLREAIDKARASLQRLGQRRAESSLRRLKRAFGRLADIDFYPGQAKRQVEHALSAFEEEVRKAHALGEPRASSKRAARLERAKYHKRVWATRKDLWVDRIASAWLIKRFIDREARFAWIERPRERPRNAVGFDFDGAQFTHSSGRVTFEVLLASFALDGDPALAKIGAAVHFLDVGGIPVADAKGLETMLTGIKEKSRGDDALLAEAMRILDLFYSAYAGRSPATKALSGRTT
jgi:hypothetical protein